MITSLHKPSLKNKTLLTLIRLECLFSNFSFFQLIMNDKYLQEDASNWIFYEIIGYITLPFICLFKRIYLLRICNNKHIYIYINML